MKHNEVNRWVTFELSLQSIDLLFEPSLGRPLCLQVSDLLLQLHPDPAHLGHLLLLLPRQLLERHATCSTPTAPWRQYAPFWLYMITSGQRRCLQWQFAFITAWVIRCGATWTVGNLQSSCKAPGVTRNSGTQHLSSKSAVCREFSCSDHGIKERRTVKTEEKQ